MNQSGSALIMVIACMALVCIGSANIFHSTWYSADIVYKKQLYEQHLQSVQGLLTYGLTVCKYMHSMWAEQGITTWHKEFDQWPCGDHVGYSSSVQIATSTTEMKVYATLIKATAPIMNLECTLVMTSHNELVIEGWKLNGAC